MQVWSIFWLYYFTGNPSENANPTTATFTINTPKPQSVLNCVHDKTLIGNGICENKLNNLKCGYDGGDCCINEKEAKKPKCKAIINYLSNQKANLNKN